MCCFFNDDAAKLVLRLGVGFTMLFHGISKMVNGIDWMVDILGVFAYAVYIGEVVAPLMLILGVFARAGGLLICATMVVASFVATGGNIFGVNGHGGWVIELQWLYFIASFAVFMLGSGKYSLCKKCRQGCKI